MQTGNVKRVMIFIDETDQWHGHNLASTIVDRARKEGCAGATVMRGTSGFGVHGQVHTTAIVDLAVSLPVVIMIIDDNDKIDRLIPVLEELVSEGLIIIDEVEAIRKTGKVSQSMTKSPDMVAEQHAVSEYMDTQFVSVAPDTKAEEVVKVLLENHRAYLPVVTADNVLLGMISSQDLLGKLVHVPEGGFQQFFMHGKHNAETDIKEQTASDLMKTQFRAVEPETQMVKAAQVMLHDKVSTLPVMKERRLVGVLRLPDVLKKALAIELKG